jgi:hypothetical protein
MRELLTFLGFYVGVMGVDHCYHEYIRWKDARAKRHADREALLDTLNAISPLYREPDAPILRAGRHAHFNLAALIGTASTHPATVEAVKGYVVHILVYSGYVMPPH